MKFELRFCSQSDNSTFDRATLNFSHAFFVVSFQVLISYVSVTPGTLKQRILKISLLISVQTIRLERRDPTMWARVLTCHATITVYRFTGDTLHRLADYFEANTAREVLIEGGALFKQ
jgi:hypothetical protein